MGEGLRLEGEIYFLMVMISIMVISKKEIFSDSILWSLTVKVYRELVNYCRELLPLHVEKLRLVK